jgi:hypothetical protein
MENNKFNNWYTSILEAVKTAEPTATVKTVEPVGKAGVDSSSSSPAVSREEIISDVDTIMTNLSQLASQVSEDLQVIEEMILEAGELDAVKDFLFAPKYRGMQKKVNKMKMNALDIQITVDNLSGASGSPEAAKKQTLKDKKSTIDSQISDLQSAIDDKAKDRGAYVQKVLKSEKIKGQMDLVKRASGQEDDPKKKKDLAASMAELQKRFEEEQAAAAALKDKAKEDQPEETADDKAAANQAAADKAAADKEAADKEAADKAAADKEAADKEAADKEAADKEAADKEAADKAAADAEAKKNADGADDATKADREKKNSKEGMLDRYKELLKKAEESGDEEKIKSIKDKIAAVSAKESWQLEGTELGRIFEAELKLLESQYKLNESRYNNLSVADKFRQLLS